MRSRYCAFALGDAGHLFRTWHPRTRPDDVDIDPAITWTGLTVLAHGEDWVEFEARYEHGSSSGRMHERSRFERRAGRWFYVDGVVS